MPGPSRSTQGSPMPSRSASGSQKSGAQGRSPQGGSRRGSPDSSSPGLEVQNLLGPTVANAFKLYDDKDRLGNFFIFQDLSVRTEGTLASYFSGQLLAWASMFPVEKPSNGYSGHDIACHIHHSVLSQILILLVTFSYHLPNCYPQQTTMPRIFSAANVSQLA